jgi:hypothetical protein
MAHQEGTSHEALETLAVRQAIWSVTATKLRTSMDLARGAVFIFSVLGAFLATVASQLFPPSAGTPGVSVANRLVLPGRL